VAAWWPFVDGEAEREDSIFHVMGKSEGCPSGGDFHSLKSRRAAAILSLGGPVEDVRLLLLHHRHLGGQGYPSSCPQSRSQIW
jgi:hypothetical protein